MEVKIEFDNNDLYNYCWAGALDTIKTVDDNGKLDDLQLLLNDIFFDKIPTLTYLNDFLWFDNDYIYEVLGIEG